MPLQKRKHDFRSTCDKRAEKRRLTVPSPVEDHAPSRTFMQFNSNKAHIIAYHKELYAKHCKQADKGHLSTWGSQAESRINFKIMNITKNENKLGQSPAETGELLETSTTDPPGRITDLDRHYMW